MRHPLLQPLKKNPHSEPIEPMYGKHYSSLYDGSMIGAGAVVFAVWGYVIACQQPDRSVGSQVDLNPKLLAFIIGEPEEEVIKAIEYLCSPDEKSRTKEQEGRRLIRIGEFSYQVVNGQKYTNIRNEAERRVQNRESQQRFREKIRQLTDKEDQLSFVPESEHGEGESDDPNVGKRRPKNKEECVAYILSLSLEERDAEWFWDKNIGCGWKNAGRPIMDWKATCRAWSKAKYFPSQKETFAPGKSAPAKSAIPLWKARELLNEQIETHPANPSWKGYIRENVTEAQREHLAHLRRKLAEVKQQEAGQIA